MRKGATPSNYKDVVQKRLIADILKTPDQEQQDDLSEVRFKTGTRQPFEGAADETVQLPLQTSVRTSTPLFGKTVIPRPKIPESLIQHQTDHSTSKKTPGTPLRTPQSLFKPSAVKLVPPPTSLPVAPSSLPAASQPIPIASGPTTLSSGTSQNFNIFNMASNLKIDKFKGDNTQNVDTWLSMYKQYCSFCDLSDKKSADSFPFHLEGHAKIWYVGCIFLSS